MSRVKYDGSPLKRDGSPAASLECCCGATPCCPDLPDELTATITNTCGAPTGTLTKIDDGMGNISYEGSVTLDCRVDAFTPCGDPVVVDVKLFYSNSIGTCVVSITCPSGGTVETISPGGYTCDPVYFTTPLSLSACGLCRINPGDAITLEITV